MSQSVLSSFFSPKQGDAAAPKAPLKASASDPILLDSDEETTSKSSKRPLSPQSRAQAGPSKKFKSSALPSTAAAFAQWRCPEDVKPTSQQLAEAGPSKLPDDSQVPLPDDFLPSLSPPKSKKEQRRHEKFVAKLLGPKNPLSRSHGYLDKDSVYAPAENPEESSSAQKKAKVDLKGKGKAKDSYTPMERQWLDIKAQHPDVLLIMEVGYKFKFFGDDAVIASKHLNIAHYMDKHFLSAMVPLPRLHIHIKRLLQAGHKVGVIRQTETAALKKVGENKTGPFERKLTELYTLATWVDDLETEDFAGGGAQSGTILCLSEKMLGGKGTDEKVQLSLVAVQPSTGDIVYDDFDDGFMRNELETRLLHLRPTEVLISKDMSKPSLAMIKHCTDTTSASPTRIDKVAKKLVYDKALSHLMEFYTSKRNEEDLGEDKSLDMIQRLSNLPEGVTMATSALIKHLKQFSLVDIFRQGDLRHFNDTVSMVLNGNTLQNLDIFANDQDHSERGSLFWLLDNCKTAFGKRQLRRWVSRPLTDIKALQERLDCVTEIVESTDYRLGKLRGLLGGLPDLERGLARVHYGRCTPQELFKVLSAFLRISSDFKEVEAAGFDSPLLNQAIAAFPTIKSKIVELLDEIDQKAAKEGNKENLFKTETFPELDDAKDNVAFVDIELEGKLSEIRKFLKKPSMQFVSIATEDYLVEVRISESSKVPSSWTKINSTKQVYRYRTDEVQQLVDERNRGLERLAEVAESCYQNFLKRLSAESDNLRRVIRKLSDVDCLISLATTALREGYAKPVLVNDQILDIEQGRHPLAEVLMDDPFVPNDVCFEKGKLESMVLTGSNAGGKSTLARMVALIVIMAQIGCYVPAETCKMGVFDAVFTRMGASDDLSRGRSTFMVELSETSEILKLATPKSLVILDELGRGTSSFDGLAIALATLSYLSKEIRAHTIFITHYAQLVNEKGLPETCRAHHMEFLESEGSQTVPDITFLYKLVKGAALRSHGLNVARIAGIPAEVYGEAYEKAHELERSTQDRQVANSSKRLFDALESDGKTENAADAGDALLHMLDVMLPEQ